MLDPFIVPAVDATTATIFLPQVSGASDCLYMAMGIGLDDNRLSINPPADTIFGEMVTSPMVSLNPNPIGYHPIPAADRVASLAATKSQGKVVVSWETAAEFTVLGFDIVAARKTGAETKLNESLIPAQAGSSCTGASYRVSFDADQLKGAAWIYLEMVKTDASKQRFGPVTCKLTEGAFMKKPYEKPAIVLSQKIEARAVVCAKASDSCGPTGPVNS